MALRKESGGRGKEGKREQEKAPSCQDGGQEARVLLPYLMSPPPPVPKGEEFCPTPCPWEDAEKAVAESKKNQRPSKGILNTR